MNAAKSVVIQTEPVQEKGFWWLIVTQFQGAFSDNVFRTLVTFIVISMNMPQVPEELRAAIVGAAFSLPFIIFSMAGGFLADRFSKRSVAIGTKVAEILVMLLAVVGLWMDNLALLLPTVFLMGAQSAFFGPSKYGLLPELLPEQRLSWGNGVLELGTFLAIISGTMLGGSIFENFRGQQVWSGVILVGLAVFGTFTSVGIARVPAADTSKKFRLNFLADLAAQIRIIRHDRVLWLALIGNTYFFFFAALIQQYAIIFYGKNLLGLSEGEITMLMAAVAIGIGLGSFAAGYLSERKIEYGLIPLGSIGLTLFGILLSRPGLSLFEVLTYISFFGFSAGFFIVPIAALLQHRPDKERKGAVLAAANLLSFVGIFLAAGVYYIMSEFGKLGPREVFLATSGMTLAGTLYVLYLLPDSFLRFLLWVLVHSVYRIHVVGRENIPPKGAGVFVADNLSSTELLLLISSTDRFVRFLMSKEIFDDSPMKLITKIAKAIRILPSVSNVREVLEAGEMVCVSAADGIANILSDLEISVISVSVKVQKRLISTVTVTYGKPTTST